MLPIVRQYNMPVTLFLYPSCISNKHAPYAMKWEQIAELQKTGLFDMQGHTFWHPNFKKEQEKDEAGGISEGCGYATGQVQGRPGKASGHQG